MDEGQFLESIVAKLLQQNPGMSPEDARRLAAARLQRPAVAAAPEQRIEGAPGIELGATTPDRTSGVATQAFDQATSERGALPGTAPPSVIDLMETRADQMRRGHSSNPKPGGVGWQEEGDLLKWEEGMTEEEFQARLQGFESAESMRKWREWVAADPQRMQRYDPEGFAEWSAAQEAEANKKHAEGLRERYGPRGSTMAEEYLSAQKEGRPTDGHVFKSPLEMEKINDRQFLESAARGFVELPLSEDEKFALGLPREADVRDLQELSKLARQRLKMSDGQSNYQGAIGGSAVSRGQTKDGTETYKDRFNRNIARRNSEEEARLALYRNQQLLGYAPTPIAQANAFSLAQDPGIDEQSQRALLNTLPGAQLGAQVDAANLDRASELAGQAIRDIIGTVGLGDTPPASPEGVPSYESLQELEQGEQWGNPAWQTYAEDLVEREFASSSGSFNWSSFTDDEVIDAANMLKDQFPTMPNEVALRIMENIQRRKLQGMTNPFSFN